MSYSSNDWEKQNETPTSEPYHYMRPDAGRENYQDASYIQTSPTMPGNHAVAPKRKRSTARIFALCLVCVLIGTAIGAAFGGKLFGNDAAVKLSDGTPTLTTEKSLERAETSTSALTIVNRKEGEMDASNIYDLACSQVVGITTEITYTNYFGMTSSSAVTGSGFILTEDGYILTNYHVIEYAVNGGYEVSVMLYDGTEYTAEIVGYENDESDIAVLKIETEGLNPAALGDSGQMRVGDTVYAVGNPLGELHYTMTRGMVSALDREITSRDSQTREIKTVNMFQIDAAVNNGNSGGPVYDAAGRVIGVVTAKYSDSGVEGLGFAIPIADAIDIANDLITQGYVSGKPSLGVFVDTIGTAAAKYYRLVEGAYIYAIEPDSCAKKAGLELGDIITKLDDTEITGSSSLRSAKKNYRAGDTAVLTIYRDGAYMECTIVFDEETGSALQTGGQTNG